MITKELRNRVEAKVLECLCKAEDVFRGHTFPMIEIRYDLKGKCAGQFCRQAGRIQYFRLNTVLMAENANDFIDVRTVPHEVAHYIVRTVYGPMAQSHGREWKDVMSKVFGLDNSRCHNYDVSNSKRQMTVHIWGCGCKDHKLSARKHNSIIRRMRLSRLPIGYVLDHFISCRICNSYSLTYKGTTIA